MGWSVSFENMGIKAKKAKIIIKLGNHFFIQQ